MAEPLISYQEGITLFCATNNDCENYVSLNSRIICKELILIDCGDRDCEIAVVNNGLYLCDCADSWNCNLCGNDLPFWNIVNPGDTIIFQFQQIDVINGQDPNVQPSKGWDSGFCFAEIYECCDDKIVVDPFTQKPILITEVAEQYFVGLYEQKDFKGESTFTNIQQIELNVNAICTLLNNPDKCFYFKFYFAKTTKEPIIFDVLCTEPFKCNPCPEKKETVLVEGVFPNKDCFGYYYGLPVTWLGTPFQYENKYRVRAAFEQSSFTIDKEVVTRQLKAVNSNVCEIWDFRTWQVPSKVAKIISNIFAARDVYLNGDLFQLEKEIPKDNEIGSQWLIDTQFKRCECFNDFSCE